jgi:hypothetical protein
VTTQDEVITLPRLFPLDARRAVARGPLFDVPTGDPRKPWGYFRRDCRDILGALCLEAGLGPPYYLTPRPERLARGWGLEGGAADLALALLRDLARRCDRGDFADRNALAGALLPRAERVAA